jgi:hypothetical protein
MLSLTYGCSEKANNCNPLVFLKYFFRHMVFYILFLEMGVFHLKNTDVKEFTDKWNNSETFDKYIQN